MEKLQYFTHDELKCPDTGDVRLAPLFGFYLSKLRIRFNAKMIVNSCCRSREYNESIGGHPKSLHVHDAPYHITGGCMAIDIDTSGWSHEKWFKFVNLAWDQGWSIGIAKTFLHIDRRIDIGMPQTKYIY